MARRLEGDALGGSPPSMASSPVDLGRWGMGSKVTALRWPVTAAVEGSDIAYLTVGLPMDSALREQRFPTMMADRGATRMRRRTARETRRTPFCRPAVGVPGRPRSG